MRKAPNCCSSDCHGCADLEQAWRELRRALVMLCLRDAIIQAALFTPRTLSGPGGYWIGRGVGGIGAGVEWGAVGSPMGICEGRSETRASSSAVGWSIRSGLRVPSARVVGRPAAEQFARGFFHTGNREVGARATHSFNRSLQQPADSTHLTSRHLTFPSMRPLAMQGCIMRFHPAGR